MRNITSYVTQLYHLFEILHQCCVKSTRYITPPFVFVARLYMDLSYQGNL